MPNGKTPVSRPADSYVVSWATPASIYGRARNFATLSPLSSRVSALRPVMAMTSMISEQAGMSVIAEAVQQAEPSMSVNRKVNVTVAKAYDGRPGHS